MSILTTSSDCVGKIFKISGLLNKNKVATGNIKYSPNFQISALPRNLDILKTRKNYSNNPDIAIIHPCPCHYFGVSCCIIYSSFSILYRHKMVVQVLEMVPLFADQQDIPFVLYQFVPAVYQFHFDDDQHPCFFGYWLRPLLLRPA